jgi:hypothetical protein
MQTVPIQIPLEVALYFVQQLPPTYQKAIFEWLLTANQQNKNNSQLIDNQINKNNKEENILSFEIWNSEFDNQNLDEFLPEYGMTLLEFRKKQFSDETDETTQMNEEQFSFFLKNEWKSQRTNTEKLKSLEQFKGGLANYQDITTTKTEWYEQ